MSDLQVPRVAHEARGMQADGVFGVVIGSDGGANAENRSRDCRVPR